MKKIGIIFAMEEEINSMLKYIKIENSYNIFNLKFYEGTINNTKVILTTSGVGKVNSARSTQILIDNMKVDLIINVGVAGGITNTLDVCDIVIASKLVQHDFDITAFNHEKGYIPDIGVYIDSDLYLFNIANEVKNELKDIDYNIHKGVIASGDIFCTSNIMTDKINKKFNALCVEMEGASIAQVCYLSRVPFIVIRSISDVPNGNNKITYEEFLDKSSNNVSNFVYKMIEKISCEK